MYAYDSCEGGVRFWVADDSFNRLCGTYNEAYQYAKELRDKHGFDVPSHAIDALREDAIDEAKRYQGPDSAVADLLDENAKLRRLVKRMFDRVNYECRCCSVFCSDWDEDNECCVFTTLMRELGVGVDE